MKKSVLLSLTMASLLSVSCASTGTSVPAADTKSTVTGPVITETSATFTPDPSNVKIQGRYFIKGGTLYLPLSACAVEFNVTAKNLTINLAGDTTARPFRDIASAPTNIARYAVYVDGELLETASVDNQKKAVKVFAGDETRTAVVRLAKLTESAQSVFGVKSIVTDPEGTISPVADKDLKIEIIGDSITCGYGVEAPDQNHSFTTQTENAEKSYSYLTAKALNADYSIVSYSGFGIYSGYTVDARNTASLVPPVYEHVCYTWGNAAFNGQKWDFSKFQPDVVVINLGTNDASYCKSDKLRQCYVDEYVKFLKTVRKDNPEAYIIVSLGIMGDELYPSAEKAAETYSAATGDTRISSFHFTVQNYAVDGLGADWHPSEITQKKKAADLTAYIQSLIDSGDIK